jgi:uncharacterized lipoprotein YmbA
VDFLSKGAITAKYHVAIAVARFEYHVPSGQVVLEAEWELLEAMRQDPVAVQGSIIREPVSDPEVADVTAAMSRALARLAHDIAAELARQGS